MRRFWIIGLFLSISGCASPILLDDPDSSDYARVSVIIGDGSNGTDQYLPVVGVVNVVQAGSYHKSHFNPIYISSLYLQTGSYQITANCRRDRDISQGYGPNKTFEIKVQGGKHYILDCTSGADEPDFKLVEAPGHISP